MHITNVSVLKNLDRDLDFILQDVTEIEGLESEEELELLRDISQLARFIDMECLNRLGNNYFDVGEDSDVLEDEFDSYIEEHNAECEAHDSHAKDKRLLDQEELLSTLKRTTFEYKAINAALYEEAECNALDIEDLENERDFQLENADILKDRISELESENNRLRVGLEIGFGDIIEIDGNR